MISRSGMTKELTGNRKGVTMAKCGTTKMKKGGMAPTPRPMPRTIPTAPRPMTPPPASAVPARPAMGPMAVKPMKSGGKVTRADGMAKRGKTKGMMC